MAQRKKIVDLLGLTELCNNGGKAAISNVLSHDCRHKRGDIRDGNDTRKQYKQKRPLSVHVRLVGLATDIPRLSPMRPH